MSAYGPTRRRLPVVLLLPVVAAVAAACGSPAGDGAPSSSSPVAAPPEGESPGGVTEVVTTSTAVVTSGAPDQTPGTPPGGAPPTHTTGGVLPSPSGVPEGCPTPPVEPEAYADAFIVAWGVGDRQRMDCLAVPEAVQYAIDYTEELGPGWEKLHAVGEQQTREVTYGSPSGKTTAQVSVNRGVFHGGPGAPQAILTVRVG